MPTREEIEKASEIVKNAFGRRPDFPSGKDYVDEVRGHSPAWKRYYYSTKGYFTKLRFSAKKRGNPFFLGRDEFMDWFESNKLNCFYCDRQLSRNGGYSSENITIDRKDNSKGYQIDNIVMSCRRCNTIKGNTFTADEMVEVADKYIKPKLERGEL